MGKLESCPECGAGLGDRWGGTGRKLQQCCYNENCGWEGEPRTPEQREIRTTKQVQVEQMPFSYTIYDCYGHVMVHSRAHMSVEKAEKELMKELDKGKNNKEGGPYTGIMWPRYVEAKAKVYK